MNNYLTIRPADLTQSSEEERRHIPVWQTYHLMEGREEIRGHGSRDMRLWGDRFRTKAGGNYSGARAQAAGRLLGLVSYLRHIQE